MTKLAYFRRSLAAQFTTDRFRCPNCGGAHHVVLDRKYFITQLRRCRHCQMMFRTPIDDPACNLSFYEDEYVQGPAAGIPSDATLTELKRSNFAGTETCYSYYTGVLTQLGLSRAPESSTMAARGATAAINLPNLASKSPPLRSRLRADTTPEKSSAYRRSTIWTTSQPILPFSLIAFSRARACSFAVAVVQLCHAAGCGSFAASYEWRSPAELRSPQGNPERRSSGPSASSDTDGVAFDALLHQRMQRVPRRNGDRNAESL